MNSSDSIGEPLAFLTQLPAVVERVAASGDLRALASARMVLRLEACCPVRAKPGV